MAILLPVGANSGCELYCDPHHQALVNNDSVFILEDFSGNGVDLETAEAAPPIAKTGIINGRTILRFDGFSDPLQNSKTFPVKCGWCVAKFNDVEFAAFQGLISGLVFADILTSNNSGTNFFNFGFDRFEFRSNDRIYIQSAMPAPMAGFKILFFRFLQPQMMDGIQIGNQRNLDRLFAGDLGLLGLYSRDFFEDEILDHNAAIAAAFAFTLPDVYRYQADIKASESPEHSVNFYDPPEGDRISEVLSESKRSLELTFSGADQKEVEYFLAFYNSHYSQGLPFIYRDCRFTPRKDFEAYFDSPYDLVGENNDWTYSVKLREK